MPNIVMDANSGISFGGNNNIQMLSDGSLGSGRVLDAAGISTGMAFLEGELEKRDPKIREPLTSVTWPRDIVAESGGGWVDFTSTMNVDYATSGGNDNSLVGGATDVISLVQANINKDVYKVFTWAQGMKIPFVDSQKFQTIGRSIDSILDRGVRLNYNKSVDQLVYRGFTSVGFTGLVNDVNIVRSTAPNGAAGSPLWQNKTVDEILWDVNKTLTEAWAASEYDESAIPNHLLLPPDKYAYIVSTRIGTSGDENILDYLLRNNLATNRGGNLYIAPCRWCSGAGTGNTDRMVAYVNDRDKVYFDLPVPLTRAMTQPVALQFAYITIYAAQMGQVKWLYYQPARYMDGI
jgi:hypothetical protein|nr:MAG TPA: major capsid protein [Caudoviricetes sp.]